jgi:hypothetical protein
MMIQTGDMYLVYANQAGERFLQPWQDLDTVGTLIDPATDEDMELVGWTIEPPTAPASCAHCGQAVAEDPDYGAYVHLDEDGSPSRADVGHYADPFG